MRYGANDAGIIHNDSGVLVGVNLGWDYVSEHEWGIDDLRNMFATPEHQGVDSSDVFGIDRRRITNPSQVEWIEWNHKKDGIARGILAASWAHYNRAHTVEVLNSDVSFHRHSFWSGWSGRDLGCFSIEPKQTAELQEIHTAIKNGDGAIWVGAGSVFANGGLNLVIVSRLPVDKLKAMADDDRKAYQLKEDARKTGIEERLRNANKRWFALSPRRAKDGSIGFWLNPQDQDIYNCGCFTVAELDEWIQGKGPIMKHPQSLSVRAGKKRKGR